MFSKNNKEQQNTFKIFLNLGQKYFVMLFVIFYSFTIIFPGQKVLAFSHIENNNFNETKNLQTASVFVKVVSSPEQSFVKEVKVSTGILELSSCNTILSNLNNNLVQQPVLLNLNSPANCFNLQLNKVVLSQRELTVKPLFSNNNTVKIVVRSQSLNAPILSSMPEIPVSPVLPITAVWLLLAYFIFKSNSVSNKTAHLTQKFINIFSLEQLQVYRC